MYYIHPIATKGVNCIDRLCSCHVPGLWHGHRLHKAPTDFTKPRQTIQSPDRLYKAPKKLYKAPTDYTKPPKDYRNLENIRQNHNY